MTTAVNTLQDIAQACGLPPEVVRAVVLNSDRPEAMHMELTAGWLRSLWCDVSEVQDSFIEFQAPGGPRRSWRLQAIDEGGNLNSGTHATRAHDYCLHFNTRCEPVFIPGGLSPLELAGRALKEARRIEGKT